MALPYPEVVTNVGTSKTAPTWTVEPGPAGSGATNLIDKEMTVPGSGTDSDLFVKLHELLHVRYTHEINPGELIKSHPDPVDMRLLQGSEDTRIHALCRKHHKNQVSKLDKETLDPVRCAELVFGHAEKSTVYDAAYWIARGHHLGAESTINAAVEAYVNGDQGTEESRERMRVAAKAAEAIKHRIDRAPDKFDSMMEAAANGTAICRTFGPDKDDCTDPDADEKSGADSKADGKSELTEEQKEQAEKAEKKSERDIEKMEKIIKGNPHERHGVPLKDDYWAPMEIGDMGELDGRLPHKLMARAKRLTDDGGRLKAPHRFKTDGKVFQRPMRGKGSPAVLFDLSGSMSLEAEHIISVLVACPGALVAGYCGVPTYDDPPKAPAKGGLGILAKGGRFTTSTRYEKLEKLIPHYGGGNYVDGPALRWLAKQPHRPKIWVSDGGVTGVTGYISAPHLLEESLRICRAAGIVRVDLDPGWIDPTRISTLLMVIGYDRDPIEIHAEAQAILGAQR